ncbi:ribbon-helix-helix protein, CopG family [Deinococcus geothermalis]|nr:ribbon-helix-helix domain-containing protein [Deinococcus geothermalis]
MKKELRLGIRVDHATYDKLQALALQQGCTMSTVIREALNKLLSPDSTDS